jgi:hypothetical protein
MKWRLTVCVLVGMVAGCASGPTSRQTYLPDGRQGFVIECPGTNQSWGDCYQQAGEVCGGRGYAVVSQVGDQGQRSGAHVYEAWSQSVMTRSLMIACQ